MILQGMYGSGLLIGTMLIITPNVLQKAWLKILLDPASLMTLGNPLCPSVFKEVVHSFVMKAIAVVTAQVPECTQARIPGRTMLDSGA